MTSCNQDPRQPELNFKVAPSELYQQFRARILDQIGEHGVSELVCAELRSWAQSYDFPILASWCRQLLRDSELESSSVCIVLECFGIAFRGDMVGHLGRDLLTGPLHSSNLELRGTAVRVLVQWLTHDGDGMWFEIGEGHLEREENEHLHEHLGASLGRYLNDLTTLDFNDFNEGFEDFDEDVKDCPEQFFEVLQDCECEMRGTLPSLKLGPVLVRLTGLEPRVMSDLVELMRMPVESPVDVPSHLNVKMSQTGDGRILHVWDTNGTFAFSVESMTQDRWIVSVYLR